MLGGAGIVVAALYVGISALILLALSLNVGRQRSRLNSFALGSIGDTKLAGAVRAHGNFIEYAPIVLLMILVLALMKASVILLHLLGIVFIVARIFHAAGMMTEKQPNILRNIGIGLTALALLVGAIACLYYAAIGITI